MVRWNSSKEGKILASLFENGIADPRFSKPADIDPIKEMREEFKQFSAQQFRNNYKRTATNWMAGKALEGQRYKSLTCESTILIFYVLSSDLNTNTPVVAFLVENKDSDEQLLLEEEIDTEEEIEEVEEEQPFAMPTPTKQHQAAPSATLSINKQPSTTYAYKEDEKKWEPFFQSTKFDSKGYNREELIIDPPSSFDGSEGSYRVSFDNENKFLVVKLASPQGMGNAHSINSYKANMYGIVTSDDSERNKRFKKSAKAIRGKWYTFRHALDWPGRSSDDMGLMPWLDYTDIDEGGKSFPLLIINIASIKPVEVDVEEASGKLTKKRFQPPSEVPGVNMAGDPNAQMASMLKQLFKAGLTTEMMTSEMKATARKFGMDPDAIGSMDVDDNKRPRKN